MAARKEPELIREIIEKGEASAIAGSEDRRRQLEKSEEVIERVQKKVERPVLQAPAPPAQVVLNSKDLKKLVTLACVQ